MEGADLQGSDVIQGERSNAATERRTCCRRVTRLVHSHTLNTVCLLVLKPSSVVLFKVSSYQLLASFLLTSVEAGAASAMGVDGAAG